MTYRGGALATGGGIGLRAAIESLLQEQQGGLTARGIADRLRNSGLAAVDKSAVNSVLYRGEGVTFKKDQSVPPRWYTSAATVPVTEELRPTLGALIARDWKSLAGTNSLALAGITLLFGANSSGKTSVLQSLLMLKQSAGSKSLVYEGPFASCDNLLNVVHRHDPARAVALGIMLLAGTVDAREALTYLRASRWDGETKSEATDVVSLSVGEEWFGFRHVAATEDSDAYWWVSSDEQGPGFANALGVPWREIPQDPVDYVFEDDGTDWPGDLDSASVSGESLEVPPQLEASWRRHRHWLREIVLGTLSRVDHLGPIRKVPDRWISAGECGEVDPGSDVVRRLKDPELSADVNDWLARLEIPYTVDVLSEGRDGALADSLVLTRRGGAGEHVRLQDVGYGISQVLPLVVQAVAARDRTIVVEQPEVHLHPRLQSRLADLLISSVQDHHNQLLVETHSEHLLLRIQRRIAEGTLDHRHMRAYYVDRVGPRAEIEPIEIDEDGQMINGWPAGFFDDRLNDLLAIADPEDGE